MPREPRNPAGKNGVDNGKVPPDEVLGPFLHQLAVENLSASQRLERLKLVHGYDIGERKLRMLNNKFDVPSVRKTKPSEYTNQRIFDEMGDDTNQRRGPNVIKTLLAAKGLQLPRSNVRAVVQAAEPRGAQLRYPGKRPAIRRAPILTIGPMHQVHCDGHDKLGKFALQMGPVGIPMYGMTDQSSANQLVLDPIPNNRRPEVVAHVYLDFVERFKCIPITLVVDKGSERGIVIEFHQHLRKTYCPDIDWLKYPPVLELPSKNNTPIEGRWHWWREFDGYNLKDSMVLGKTKGIFNSQDTVHVNLFYWIWVPIVQAACNQFKDWWNAHPLRGQRKKLGPSGATPNQIFMCPQKPAQRVSIPIPQEAIDELRKRVPITRAEAFCWVDPGFELVAMDAYKHIGKPELSRKTAWDTFIKMANVIGSRTA